MAATVNLDPQAGVELAGIITQLLDGVVLETVQNMYQAARSMGDENNLVEGIKAKFMSFQAKYNDELVGNANRVKKSFEEFTDFAEYVAKLQIDSSVKDVEVGQVKPNTYDAAKNL